MKNILILLAFVSVISLLPTCTDSTPPPVQLKATISFSGTQFVIVNNDRLDYRNATLEVNEKYDLKMPEIKAGETYTVGIMQFADKSGNRFSPMQKPQKFTIFCKLANGREGFVSANWN